MVLDISIYEPFFYNKTNHKNRKQKNNVYDKLCYILYHKLNEKDVFYKYNEKNEKIKILELLEPIKIKNKMSIINNLNDEDINLMTLNFICYILKINIIWYTDKCYYKMNNNDKHEVLYLYNNEKFTDETDLSDKYEITDIDKPLKSMSYYKLSELKEMNESLRLPTPVIKKKELYETISTYYKNIKLI